MDLQDKEYEVFHGDCIPHMSELPEACFDFSVFSPPFPSLYAYTNREEDLGNSEDLGRDAKLHLGFFYRQLARVVKPGRVIMVHVAQIPRMKRSGGQGLCDFRGLNIRLGERSGLTFEYDWSVRKNPQSQAIRTRSRELQFVGLERDRARSRGTLQDYLLKFTVPGENEVAVDSEDQVSRNNWIDWAEGCWSDIRETDTLNVAEGRGEEDTKHICPLQLQVIDRLIRLYTNPGEIVFSPFAGIGSEGSTALKLGRRFYGCELKAEYHAACLKNLERAITQRIRDVPLFDLEALNANA
jgi:DNA modification methylase